MIRRPSSIKAIASMSCTAPRDIERQILFADALTRNSAAIESAVARVDNDGAGLRMRFARKKRGSKKRKCENDETAAKSQ